MESDVDMWACKHRGEHRKENWFTAMNSRKQGMA